MANKMMKCTSCGAEIAKSAKTCPQCGAKNKKPIAKRLWFWIVVVIIGLGVIGNLNKRGDAPTNSSQSSANTPSASSDVQSSRDENTTSANTNETLPQIEGVPPEQAGTTPAPEASEVPDESDVYETDSVFSPQDVSDETIKSIRTYSDYLVMYRLIIEDYYANYEAVVKGTILYNEETFAIMKQSYDEAFESQKTIYERIGLDILIDIDMRLELTKVLIELRDELKEYTDSMAETLKGFDSFNF